MRKALTILALLGLAVGISARTASADGVVDYTVSGAFGSTVFGDTSLSAAGDNFTVTFSVDPADLVSSTVGMSNAITISLDYTDFVGTSTTVRNSLSGEPGTVTFFTESQFGLFDLDFFVPSPDGDHFTLQLFGPDAGFNVGPPLTLNTGGPFVISPGDDIGDGSLLGDFTSGTANSITSGSVTTSTSNVPEPSSILLLGSGFLALGAFARKRLFASGN